MSKRPGAPIVAMVVLVALAAGCGGQSTGSPSNPLPTGASTATPTTTNAPTQTTQPPASSQPTGSTQPTQPPAVAVPLLEPAASVNSYYCVTQFDHGTSSDYLWITTVRDHDAQSLRYDSKRDGQLGNYLMTQIGDRQWEDVGQGFKVSDTDTDLERAARAFEVPALFTRFFIDTQSLAGFSTGDELENASNIMSHVYRAGDQARSALTADEEIGSVLSAAYAVSADAGVLVEARINGTAKTGGDFYLTLTCNQYDDPSQVITAP